MDIKKITKFYRKNVRITMRNGTIYMGFFRGYADDDDVEVDTIELLTKEKIPTKWKDILVPDIKSIEVVE
jgi:hypothetical protein